MENQTNEIMQSPSEMLLSKDMAYLRKDVEQILGEIKNIGKNYVTQKEFWPIKAIVYGATGLILVGVFGALVALVVSK